jgi:uncharacterized protein (DUF3820 family)
MEIKMSSIKKNKQEIVPFGKYKGQPLEALIQDESYAKWLTSQDWFQDKFGKIYTLIINNFNVEQTETPEHNEIQVKFLQSNYCLKLAYAIYGDQLFQFNQKHFETNFSYLKEYAKSTSGSEKELHKIISSLNGNKFLHISDIGFEKNGIDVSYTVKYGYGDISIPAELHYSVEKEMDSLWKCIKEIELRVEIKPTISDDFPQVLRQTKAEKANILLLKEFHGVGATYDEFKQFFESQGIKVITQAYLENVQIPSYDLTISTTFLQEMR